jgi:hypothetical protein
MGHWEQTGRDNLAWRARRAALPRWRRRLGELLWIVAGLAVLALYLLPLLRGLGLV